MNKKRRPPPHDAPVGILGGVFDPIHYGHLATAKLALDYFGLSKILFIPSGAPPHKPAPCASARNRLAMLRCAVGTYRRFEVWDGELRRAGPSYTVDTLRQLSGIYPRTPFFFIIGSDNLQEMPLWYEYRTLLSLAYFCIAPRPGYTLKIPRRLSSMNGETFPGPQWGISSTMVREYLQRGYSCDFLLPHSVIKYIHTHRLYVPKIA